MIPGWFTKKPTREGEYLVHPSYGGMDVWYYMPENDLWVRYDFHTDLFESLKGKRPIRWTYLPAPKTEHQYKDTSWCFHPLVLERKKRRSQ